MDNEYYRLTHKNEFDENYKQKTKVETVLPKDFEFSDDFNSNNDQVQYRRDKKLAERSPEKYCADRCLSTGSCEVYEDFFKLSPSQVIEFCSDCVLNDDEDALCDIPDAFYGDNEGASNMDVHP